MLIAKQIYWCVHIGILRETPSTASTVVIDRNAWLDLYTPQTQIVKCLKGKEEIDTFSVMYLLYRSILTQYFPRIATRIVLPK